MLSHFCEHFIFPVFLLTKMNVKDKYFSNLFLYRVGTVVAYSK